MLILHLIIFLRPSPPGKVKIYHIIDLVKSEIKKNDSGGQHSYESMRLEEVKQMISFCTPFSGMIFSIALIFIRTPGIHIFIWGV